MLSLLKKSDKASALQPAWHPNFRNVEHLPDTKAVRTSFFFNGMSVLLAVVLLTYVAYKEYSLRAVHANIDEWQQTIDASKKGSDAAIANFKKFQAQEQKFNAAERLLDSRIVLSDLILHLGATLPKEVILRSIDYDSSGVNLVGSVMGAPEVASGMVTKYLEQLRNDPVLKKSFDQVELTNMSRNGATDGVSMEVILRFPTSKKKK